MNICFVLPQMLRKPVGGYKMVYEYANRLSDNWHNVAILFLNDNALKRFKVPKLLRKELIEIFTQVEPRWFSLNNKVKKYSSTNEIVSELDEKFDLAIATGVDTVEKTIQIFKKAKKAYFIQGYENWVYPDEKIDETFRVGLDNIVIAEWLKDKVEECSGKTPILIKNPIDTSVYKMKQSIEERNPYTIGVLYHSNELKGFKYAYDAIIQLKQMYPELKIKMFGTSKPDFKLPSWIEFTLNASKEDTVKIYNSVSIFLCATVSEGYGLTGLEAMSCGAVLVSTDYNGVKEYAVNEENALLSPVKNVEALVCNVKKVIEDYNLRKRLSSNGISRAKNFSWEKAISLFENYIQTSCKNREK